MIALARTATRAATTLRRTLPHKRILFAASTGKWNRKQFLQHLDSDISEAEKQVIDHSQNEAYFINKGWSINYIERETMFEFYKLDGEH